MPSSFAEAWLRIYTKDRSFHGLIQAAYRHILKNLVSASPPAPAAAVSMEEVQEEEGFDPNVLGGTVGEDLDLQPFKVWRPGTPTFGEGPSTPRTFSRNVSTTSVSGLGVVDRRSSRAVGRTPSFSENQFTAVPPNFRGESPSRKPRSKRGRDGNDSSEGERPRKSLRLSEKCADTP